MNPTQPTSKATAKHTPGPWTLVKQQPMLYTLFASDPDGAAPLMEVRASEVDASLIAAAPDLLAALDDLIAWQDRLVLADSPGKEGRALAYYATMQNARAALAKAVQA